MLPLTKMHMLHNAVYLQLGECYEVLSAAPNAFVTVQKR